MQMRACADTGISAQSYLVTLLYLLPGGYQYLAQMSVPVCLPSSWLI